MKTLVILLFGLLLAILYVGAEKKQCKDNNGVCIAHRSVRKSSCQNELPYECGPAAVCCQKKKLVSKSVNKRRNCSKTRKICSKEGGKCVKKEENDCKTITVDELCKGYSCTCCLGDNLKCGKAPACTENGGICMNKKKTHYCQGGTIDEQLCDGKTCACCLLNKGPSCKCGQANDVRIVDGEEVSPRFKYPWMVGMSSNIEGFIRAECGASIISDRYVLTAAHCLCNQTTAMCYRKEFVTVKVADHLTESPDDDLVGVTMVLHIEEIILNLEYFRTDVEDDGDIALLKLKEPLDLTAHKELKPVCLPTDKSKTYAGYDAIVAGWGDLGSSDYDSPDELREVTVPILDADCLEQEITDNMLCAGFPKGGKDSCAGDSGGPLIVKEGNTYTQVGIVSWGRGCALPDSPGVYTRVTQYLEWIAENTRDSNYCSG